MLKNRDVLGLLPALWLVHFASSGQAVIYGGRADHHADVTLFVEGFLWAGRDFRAGLAWLLGERLAAWTVGELHVTDELRAASEQLPWSRVSSLPAVLPQVWRAVDIDGPCVIGGTELHDPRARIDIVRAEHDNGEFRDNMALLVAELLDLMANSPAPERE
ncbi:hypothetical protein [Saccharopolyspora sp. NPDC050642]|uniref:hypothetical protein n=1 Tax=Saccharopolyspora sp. NPDC050642 TaxID=3157099 RepID=UPI0033C67C48